MNWDERMAQYMAGVFDSEKPYTFISYSHNKEDVEKVYTLLDELMKRGINFAIDTEYASKMGNWMPKMNNRLKVQECKCMMSFYSRSYVYSRPSLLEQLMRYSEQVKLSATERKETYSEEMKKELIRTKTMPSIVISLFDSKGIKKQIENKDEEQLDRIKKSKSDWELIEGTSAYDFFLDGLSGYFSSKSNIDDALYNLGNVDRLDSIRTYFLKILEREEQNNTNLPTEVDNIVKMLASFGVKEDTDIKQKANKLFGMKDTLTKESPTKESPTKGSPIHDNRKSNNVIVDFNNMKACVFGKNILDSNPTKLYVGVMEEILRRYPEIIGNKETHFTYDRNRAAQYTGTTREINVNDRIVYIKTGFSTNDKKLGIRRTCELANIEYGETLSDDAAGTSQVLQMSNTVNRALQYEQSGTSSVSTSSQKTPVGNEEIYQYQNAKIRYDASGEFILLAGSRIKAEPTTFRSQSASLMNIYNQALSSGKLVPSAGNPNYLDVTEDFVSGTTASGVAKMISGGSVNGNIVLIEIHSKQTFAQLHGKNISSGGTNSIDTNHVFGLGES